MYRCIYIYIYVYICIYLYSYVYICIPLTLITGLIGLLPSRTCVWEKLNYVCWKNLLRFAGERPIELSLPENVAFRARLLFSFFSTN